MVNLKICWTLTSFLFVHFGSAKYKTKKFTEANKSVVRTTRTGEHGKYTKIYLKLKLDNSKRTLGMHLFEAIWIATAAPNYCSARNDSFRSGKLSQFISHWLNKTIDYRANKLPTQTANSNQRLEQLIGIYLTTTNKHFPYRLHLELNAIRVRFGPTA